MQINSVSIKTICDAIFQVSQLGRLRTLMLTPGLVNAARAVGAGCGDGQGGLRRDVAVLKGERRA